MKHFRQQQHRPKKSSLVVGRKQVIEALQSGKALERVYLQNNAGGETVELIRKLSAESGVPVNKVPVEKLNGFNIEHHEGCVAVISKIQYQDLQQVISFVVEKGETPLFLMLDGVTDIRNIGGIARTAYCCGVQTIIIPEKGVGALNEDAILTSAGALEKLAICRVSNLLNAINELHLNGIRVIATDMEAEKNVFELDLKEPVTFVIGSEDNGISPAIMKACDEVCKIPMAGDFESLNVSVATGMVLYEAMRQKLQS